MCLLNPFNGLPIVICGGGALHALSMTTICRVNLTIFHRLTSFRFSLICLPTCIHTCWPCHSDCWPEHWPLISIWAVGRAKPGSLNCRDTRLNGRRGLTTLVS